MRPLGRAIGSWKVSLRWRRGQRRRVGQLLAAQPLDAVIEHFSLARHLLGLATRPVGLRLELRDLQLLALRLGHRALFRRVTLAQVGAVVAVVRRQRLRARVQVQHARDRLVEQDEIVRDQQCRALVAREVVHQPERRRAVEVVGRLVQQQQIVGGESSARASARRVFWPPESPVTARSSSTSPRPSPCSSSPISYSAA